MAAVVANTTCRVAGTRQLVVKGAIYDDSDPVVKNHPDLFDKPDRAAQRQKPVTSTAELGERSMSTRNRTRDDGPVEQATAAPGEKRSTRRPAKKTASKTSDD